MVYEEGTVCSVSKNGWAEVVTQKKASCAHCTAGHSCQSFGSGSKMVIKALNRAGAGVGDHVSLAIKHQSAIKLAAIIYMIPVASFIIGTLTGAGFSQSLGLSEGAATLIFGFAGLSLGFLVMVLVSRWLSAKNELTPVITDVRAPRAKASGSLRSTDPVCGMCRESAHR